MATLDQIADLACSDSGADFAFVLTQKGRLATRHAPQEMPEAGRMAIIELARKLLKESRGLGHLELPRQALVPYGGAAPIEIYVAAREEAVLCVVLASFTQRDRVAGAMSEAIKDLDALLDAESHKRGRRRGRKSGPPSTKGSIPPSRGSRPPKSSTGSRRKSLVPPSTRGLDFADMEVGRSTIPFMAPLGHYRRSTAPPPLPPEISVKEASVGRATLAAIELDAEGPELTYGLAPLGRGTIAEIEMSMVPQGDPRSSLPDIRVDLASLPEIRPEDLDATDRQTLPFVEPAEVLKRVFDVATGRAPAPVPAPKRSVVTGSSGPKRVGPRVEPFPHVDVSVDDIEDPDTVVDVAEADLLEEPKPELQDLKSGGAPRGGRDSGIDAWHEALAGLVTDKRVQKGATGFGKIKKPR